MVKRKKGKKTISRRIELSETNHKIARTTSAIYGYDNIEEAINFIISEFNKTHKIISKELIK